MTEQVQLSIWKRSTFGRCCRWLFSWRGIRRILIIAAWTATVIALIYGEENWRGRRAWNKYRQALEARGEQLDFKAFIPKPIDTAQNSAATPFFDFIFAKKNPHTWEDNFSRAYKQVSNQRLTGSKAGRRVVDLVAWEMALGEVRSGHSDRQQRIESGKLDLQSRSNAGPAVLQALKISEPVFAELRAAAQRMSSRYAVVYKLEDPWGILLPHLASIKAVVQRLQLKACAELAAGANQDAMQDVKLMLRLGDSVKEESFLISYLVRVACFQLAVQPIWEGLADHRWSEAQLQDLQAQLQQYDFLGDVKRPLDGERAGGILTADLLYNRKYQPGSLLDESDLAANPFGTVLANLIARIAPHGWYYLEQLNYCRLFDLQMTDAFDVAKRQVSPGQIEANMHELARTIAGGRLGKNFKAVLHHQTIAMLLLPALDKAVRKATTAQTTADQASVACALERYRQANGQFPEKLEMLVPRFISRLPRDLITGDSYKYHRTEGGRFVLYSVGWNENDDGGVPGKTLFNDQGDWVWE